MSDREATKGRYDRWISRAIDIALVTLAFSPWVDRAS